MNIILASNSPRRKEILNQLNLNFEVIPSSFEELSLDMEPKTLVEHFAYMKAKDVYERHTDIRKSDTYILGSDTIVYNGRIMGKPKDDEDAYQMLKELSGREHMVISGISIIKAATGQSMTRNEITRVCFRNLSDREIWKYIVSGESKDKAGSYAIQGIGSLFVKEIKGCYFNVVGLPVQKFNEIMNEFGKLLL
ncbi:MAG: Maf family protein [Lutisporaceae bacterium]